ncbi:phosphohistidine phosphatase [Ekhidna lutea]|uniref:Phosphohistidine phosphatase n=1 Tax=Ekhidna lutea TaxID=447679 RepID=A0A239L5J2_EKHLU|nr:histidine phosphatase family protein [Ekhidna lutea]SNT25168.1 phosphohistidine phosphatase [Ekhidna lutea]
MRRKLYLIRHSYAENSGGKPDEKRELTHEGQSTVRSLGRHLINVDFNPDIIFCSTSVRTKETAMNLVEELEMSEQVVEYMEVIYNASVRELLQVVNAVSADYPEIAIIGHNPTISYFGEFLTNSGIGNMEPCSVVTINFDDLNWVEISQGTGNFESYYHPNH